MEEGIKIQKTTLALLVALIGVMILGAYIVSASSFASSSRSGTDGGQKTGTNDTGPGPAQIQEKIQGIYLHANRDGTYDKQEITVNQNQPVRLHFTADASAGCGRQVVIYGLGISASSMNGEEGTADFTPKDAGTYDISCGMRMWGPAKLIVR